MKTISISKDEYLNLKKQSALYTKFMSRFFESLVEDSPKRIATDFKNTGLYNNSFLTDLEDGLHKLFKSKAWKSR